MDTNKLPKCPICMDDFDTDFSVLNYCTDHRLPVSCLCCSGVVCFACLLQQRTTVLLRAEQKHDDGLVFCPLCLNTGALNIDQPNYNRPFASLLEDMKRNFGHPRTVSPRQRASTPLSSDSYTTTTTSPTFLRLLEEATRRAQVAEREQTLATQRLSAYLSRHETERRHQQLQWDEQSKRATHEQRQVRHEFQQEKKQLLVLLQNTQRQLEQLKRDSTAVSIKNYKGMEHKLTEANLKLKVFKQQRNTNELKERKKKEQREQVKIITITEPNKSDHALLEARALIKKLEQRCKESEKRADRAETEQLRLFSLLAEREREEISWRHRVSNTVVVVVVVSILFVSLLK